ncbi:MAG: hypothetical protein N3A58_00705 [Spirochaetes bacterium]|nr:hypothetical protein [Spirochaetota bacterium]
MIDLIKEFKIENNKIYSIIGISKNSGKTTLLNYLIRNIDNLGKNYFLTSIGIDGESIDQVTKSSKPDIYISKGNIFTSSKIFIKELSTNFEIINCINETTILGDIYICKAKNRLKVKICGPSTNEKLKYLTNNYRNYVDYIFIDGALDRISTCSPLISDGYILSISTAYANTENEFINHLKNLHYKLRSIEKFNENIFCEKVLIHLENKIIDNQISNVNNLENIRSIYKNFNYNIFSNSIVLFNKDMSFVKTNLSSIIGNEDFIINYIDKIIFLYVPQAITDRSLEKLVNKSNSFFYILLKDPSKNFISFNYYSLIKKRGFDIFYLYKPELKGITTSSFHPYKKILLNPIKLKNIIKEYFEDINIFDLFYDT